MKEEPTRPCGRRKDSEEGRKEGTAVNDAFRDPARKNSGSCWCLMGEAHRQKLSQAPRQPQRHSSSTSSSSVSPPPPSTASSSLPRRPIIRPIFDWLRYSYLLASSQGPRIPCFFSFSYRVYDTPSPWRASTSPTTTAT